MDRKDEVMRKLAQVSEILEVKPIEGADAIELVRVLGWWCIAKKGEFLSGAKCVYFELDSLLPMENPAFHFMESRGFRVKTLKLGKFGVISQGLTLPLSVFPLLPENLEVGLDLTEYLGVKKWEPSENETHRLPSLARRAFPSVCPRTDESRIQSNPRLIEEFLNQECYITLKCDGTSATFVHNDGEYDVCSRNLSVKDEPSSVWWNISRKYDLENKLRSAGNFAIQGEIVGPSIEKNKMSFSERRLFVFTVINVSTGKHLGFRELKKFCSDLNLEMVPVVSEKITFNHTIEQLLEIAKGEYEGTANPREGIVIRTIEPQYSHSLLGIKSFKVINNDYLIKYKQ